jgi:hypothetical protein
MGMMPPKIIYYSRIMWNKDLCIMVTHTINCRINNKVIIFVFIKILSIVDIQSLQTLVGNCTVLNKPYGMSKEF